MKEKHPFYVINGNVLPEVFLKVVEVKNLLEKNKMLTVQEATERVGISRSSFYKYKDSIFPFYEKGQGKAITVLMHLQDEAGRLSDVLNYIAAAGGNVLTINQMIPMNGTAIINLCIQTSHMKMGVDKLIEELTELEGVNEIQILARE
ncbi:MAG: ACT domain-containing protein [Cellulosilyticum sp.]|nr:ACT domain-containing protein [Cellulosilyticum sp.]